MQNKLQRDVSRFTDVLHYVLSNGLNLMGGVIAVVTGILAIIVFGDRTMFYSFATTSFLAGLFLVFRLGYRNLELV
jgi:hypothetical protein